MEPYGKEDVLISLIKKNFKKKKKKKISSHSAKIDVYDPTLWLQKWFKAQGK